MGAVILLCDMGPMARAAGSYQVIADLVEMSITATRTVFAA